MSIYGGVQALLTFQLLKLMEQLISMVLLFQWSNIKRDSTRLSDLLILFLYLRYSHLVHSYTYKHKIVSFLRGRRVEETDKESI